jgi:glycosyltransferase involved in cell wall biosynthesis
MHERPSVICLTPVKNEAWILDRFLQCASLWADHIIIADQMSDDGSREIALKYPKVTLIENQSPAFDELERQRLLINAARCIAGPRLLIALDADEMLTANCLGSPEWDKMLSVPQGTVIAFRWPIICSDLSTYWLPRDDQRFGFMDDNSEHTGRKIHSVRVPAPADAQMIRLQDIKVMHYVGVDQKKWDSKHRWYQCWESLNRKVSPTDIYRRYHKKDVIPKSEIRSIPDEWMRQYNERGIDMTSIPQQDYYDTDKKVLEYFLEFGTARFKRLSIWDVDWTDLYKKIFNESPKISLEDPRSLLEKTYHRWLRKTQRHFSYFDHNLSAGTRTLIKYIQRSMQIFGW